MRLKKNLEQLLDLKIKKFNVIYSDSVHLFLLEDSLLDFHIDLLGKISKFKSNKLLYKPNKQNSGS